VHEAGLGRRDGDVWGGGTPRHLLAYARRYAIARLQRRERRGGEPDSSHQFRIVLI
jgi:hypothetical protein